MAPRAPGTTLTTLALKPEGLICHLRQQSSLNRYMWWTVHTVEGRRVLPSPGPPPSPHTEIKGLVEKYLGSARRAGQGIGRCGGRPLLSGRGLTGRRAAFVESVSTQSRLVVVGFVRDTLSGRHCLNGDSVSARRYSNSTTLHRLRLDDDGRSRAGRGCADGNSE
jgi:hypothetical protein